MERRGSDHRERFLLGGAEATMTVTGSLVALDSVVDSLRPRTGKPTSDLSDSVLLYACAAGDENALKELVYRYEGLLYRFLYRLLDSPEDAEEATLEVFVRAWQNAPRFEHRSKVGTWLYRIAVNIARDAHDRRRARPQTASSETGDLYALAQESMGNAEQVAQRRLEQAERGRVLLQAVNALEPDDRLVLVLYYLEDQEYREIQAVTGWSYPVLKTRLARARRRLRSLLEISGLEISEEEGR